MLCTFHKESNIMDGYTCLLTLVIPMLMNPENEGAVKYNLLIQLNED